MITISNFEVERTHDGVDVSCKTDIDQQTTRLSFSIIVDDDLADIISPHPIAFAFALLIPAMERGEDIHINADIDAALLHRVNAYVIPMLNSKYPKYKQITVTSDGVLTKKPHTSKPLGAMTGMSCGVDSLRTQLIYGDKGDVPDKYRLTALSVFDVGAFFNSDLEFPRILKKAREIGALTGCKAIGVRSDFDKFYGYGHRDSCTVRHVACAYCLSDLIDVYMVSSAYEWDGVNAYMDSRTAFEAIDPMLLPMLASDDLEMWSAAASESRLTKTQQIISHSPFIHTIDLCTRPSSKRDISKNCGSCKKCAAFLLIAESMGKLDDVAPYFDIASFKKRRFRIYQRVFTSTTIEKTLAPNLVSRLEGETARKLDAPFGAIAAGTLFGKLILLARKLRLLEPPIV